MSKIVGHLLDRLFTLSQGPHDPGRVWGWVENLNFHKETSADRSPAVAALRRDHALRQGIQRLALGHLTKIDEVRDRRFVSFDWQCHSGLRFENQDCIAMADYAFEHDNPGLWAGFLWTHNPHNPQTGSNELRRHMRTQASQKPAFMRLWAKQHHGWEQSQRQYRERRLWSERRRRRRERRIEDRNASHFRANRELIESGRHWGWLCRFANWYLIRPDELEDKIPDITVAEASLRNCIDYVKPHAPTLEQLGLGEGQYVARILHAACLAIYRQVGHLNDIDPVILKAVKTDVHGGYNGVGEDETEAFDNALNQRLFSSRHDLESFLRAYVEPQLAKGSRGHTNPDWLGYREEFAPLRNKLAIEWLTRFRVLSLHKLDQLFDLTAQHCSAMELYDLIRLRCAEFLFFWPDETEDEELEGRRHFWFLRHFIFLDEGPDAIWQSLAAHDDTLFALEHRIGRMNRSENAGWPDLPPEKIYRVLDAFFSRWPKVPLPESWGSHSPREEIAYRFLVEIIWDLDKADPDRSLPVLERIVSEARFSDIRKAAQNLRATAFRKKALRDFEAPVPAAIVTLLDENKVATVEGLRLLLCEELAALQREIRGGEFDPLDKFYVGGIHVDETTASKRIAEHLRWRLEALDASIAIEHHMKESKRCDITVAKVITGSRRLLVIEVKGQWHPELFTAASTQLYERYAIHPDAGQQGIYLVLWFWRE